VSWIELDFDGLRQRHAALLFDAYGVLVDARGALGTAGESIATLEREGQPWLVVTNDASRSADTAAKRYQSLGIPVKPERVLSSGMLLAPHFARRGLRGARCVVLGTGDSSQYVREAGGEVIAADADTPADVVVLCDERGFEFLSTMDALLTMLLRACEAGRAVELLVPNPDLIYPSEGGRFGFTAGTLARMLEEALALRLGPDAPRFIALGKPSRAIFEAACERVGTRDCVMLGDQLHTDVAGAHGAELRSAIVLTGVTTRESLRRAKDRGAELPTYVLSQV
jgi:HAD superfamily hydrolase (TIGR01450 family)